MQINAITTDAIAMTPTYSRLKKIEAAWELVAEDIAGLWVDGVELKGPEREVAEKLEGDIEHFLLRLQEMNDQSP